MKSVKTPKGTILPLTNLKGKDYLMVAYRIQWMNEEAENFTINTEALNMSADESVVKATVTLLNKDGSIKKSSTATKREDAKGFGDHLEKAETGAIGRALALLGFGTQFATADLDEGDRIVDSPVVNTKSTESIAAKPVSSASYGFKAPKSNILNGSVSIPATTPAKAIKAEWT